MLVTGAQINGDGTARMDFDLPDADNDLLRALVAPLNDVIRQGLDVRATYVSASDARNSPGLIRSLSVAPPPGSFTSGSAARLKGRSKANTCGLTEQLKAMFARGTLEINDRVKGNIFYCGTIRLGPRAALEGQITRVARELTIENAANNVASLSRAATGIGSN